MTDKAPERIWGILTKDDESPHWFGNLWSVQCSEDDVAWVPADLLDAANARIAELEAEVSAWRQVQDAVAELEGHGPDWPSHGNAPLAVTAGYALHRQRAATARAEALEEAAKLCDVQAARCEEQENLSRNRTDLSEEARCEMVGKWMHKSLALSVAATAIRALKGGSNG